MKYRSFIMLIALAIPATAQSVTTYGTAKWNRSDTVAESLRDSELLDALHLVGIYQQQYTAQRVAELAFEAKSGTKESKRPLQESFDAKKKAADETMGKLASKIGEYCAVRKMKECVLEVPSDNPRDAKLRGTK